MYLNRPQLWEKLNSLVNHYGGDENFIKHMDEWPKTVKELIYSSEKLMIRFKLIELIPDLIDDEDVIIGME
jgi:hypothetical protein